MSLLPLTLRTLAAHEWATYRALRLRALADAPDAFGSTLAAEQLQTPDAWVARLSAAAVSDQDYPLVAELAGTAVGLVWAKVDATQSSVINVFQLWVAPESRGRGVAMALLQEAIKWARYKHARLVQLSVTCGDTAAMRLYLRAGFQAVSLPTPRLGSLLFEQTMQLAID
jgi:ribosomal protein S18 acetylase RimI-like enzyme